MDEFSSLLDLGLSILCFGAIGDNHSVELSRLRLYLRCHTDGRSELGCLGDAILRNNNVGFSHSPGPGATAA